MGAPGVEEVRWLRPVLPGETVEAELKVIDVKESKSRPEMGLVRFETEVRNPRGEAVLGQTNWIMIGRRGHSWPPRALSRPDREAPRVAPPPATDVAALPIASPFLDDLEVGAVTELGAVTFEPDAIIRFAKAFDPQIFHVDPEAARQTAFGGLCASGWHTGSAWMRLMVDHRQRCRDEAIRRGETPADLGPSPGFRNLRWVKPVYAGDTVAYRSTLTGARPSANRPGWGIASHRNSGVNQHGEEVFSFEGAVLWQRRP
jgi:acyl dehydratase